MKRAVTLPDKLRAELATFYDSEGYRALKTLLEAERMEIAKDLLEEKDKDTIIFLQGQAFKCKQIHQYIRDLAKTDKSS